MGLLWRISNISGKMVQIYEPNENPGSQGSNAKNCDYEKREIQGQSEFSDREDPAVESEASYGG